MKLNGLKSFIDFVWYSEVGGWVVVKKYNFYRILFLFFFMLKYRYVYVCIIWV